jgi:hypothetical protein
VHADLDVAALGRSPAFAAFLSALVVLTGFSRGGDAMRVVVPGTGRIGRTETVAGSVAKFRNSRPSGHGASW